MVGDNVDGVTVDGGKVTGTGDFVVEFVVATVVGTTVVPNNINNPSNTRDISDL